MRKLAIFAGSFSAAVFGANYLLPEKTLLPLGLALALLCPILHLLLRKGDRRRRLALVLISAGLAVGLIWTAVYSHIWFRPAQDLDDRTVRLTAAVADWPRETEYGCSVLIRVDTENFVRLSAILYTDQQGADLRPGDKISTVAHCMLGDRTFAGEEITYYTAKGIFLRAQAYGRLDVQRPEHIPIRYWPAAYAKSLKTAIDGAFPADAAPVVRALVTGNRDHLTDEFTTSLERTGLSHTVAVSGMHLAFLASLLTLLMGRGKRSTALLTVAWAVLFCGVAGNTPSVIRAAVMIVMLQLAPLVRRERDGITSLAFALMLLLVWNPFSAAHIGLQLSFGAVAGILLVSDRLQSWMLDKLGLAKRRKKRAVRLLLLLPKFVVATLSATLGAMVLTVPLVAVHFQTVSLIAPISNLCTLWAVSLLFLAGLVIGTVGVFSSSLAAVMAIPFTPLARYLDWMVNKLGELTFSALPLGSVYYRFWLVFLYLLLGAALVVKGKKTILFPACAGAVTLAVSVLFTAVTFRMGVMTASVLDVGQGQSVLLRLGDFVTLVDCGGDAYDNAGDTAADYVQAKGYNKIDLLVVSHCHADHVNGIPQLLRRVRVDLLVLPEGEEDSDLRHEILTLAQEKGTEVRTIQEDTYLDLGGNRAVALFAPLGQGTKTNELGLTVLASAGEHDVLITGDMGGDVEQLLRGHTELPDVEMLVAGHHGSEDSTTPELLAAVKPELAVVSVGAHNSYGHPAMDTLIRLDEAGADIYRTDLYGTVTVQFRKTIG